MKHTVINTQSLLLAAKYRDSAPEQNSFAKSLLGGQQLAVGRLKQENKGKLANKRKERQGGSEDKRKVTR